MGIGFGFFLVGSRRVEFYGRGRWGRFLRVGFYLVVFMGFFIGLFIFIFVMFFFFRVFGKIVGEGFSVLTFLICMSV